MSATSSLRAGRLRGWAKRRWTPRLRTVLLVVNITVMLLPLGGLTILQLYEDETVRQKEAALYAQGAYVTALYRQALVETFQGRRVDGAYGVPGPGAWLRPSRRFQLGLRVIPTLRLAQTWIREPHASRDVRLPEIDEHAGGAGRAISPVIYSAQTLALDAVRVVDPQGVVVASSVGEEGRLLVMWEEVQRALQGEYVSLVRRRVPERRTRSPLDSLNLGLPVQVWVALPILVDDRVVGAAVLSGTPSRLTEFVYGNRGKLLNGLAMIMIVVTLLSVLSSLTISEPIQAIIEQTERVARGDPAGARPISWPILREGRMLTSAISAMARTLQDRAQYIMGFARNVSHEFKTPLTSIAGTTELLREHWREMSDAERGRFLDTLHREATRLATLVRRLLDFARADVATSAGDATDAVAVVAAAVADYAAQGLAVALAPAAATRVAMSSELLTSIVTNLLDNARVHGGAGVHVEVALSPSTAGRVALVVRDDGAGISAANLAQVFKPFFTTARNAGGTGLGLSIVQSLARAHGGAVTIEPAQERGVIVTVTLPRA